jgi:hypothetical protein
MNAVQLNSRWNKAYNASTSTLLSGLAKNLAQQKKICEFLVLLRD